MPCAPAANELPENELRKLHGYVECQVETDSANTENEENPLERGLPPHIYIYMYIYIYIYVSVNKYINFLCFWWEGVFDTESQWASFGLGNCSGQLLLRSLAALVTCLL